MMTTVLFVSIMTTVHFVPTMTIKIALCLNNGNIALVSVMMTTAHFVSIMMTTVHFVSAMMTTAHFVSIIITVQIIRTFIQQGFCYWKCPYSVQGLNISVNFIISIVCLAGWIYRKRQGYCTPPIKVPQRQCNWSIVWACFHRNFSNARNLKYIFKILY